MRAEDHFHTGIIVDDFEETLTRLSELFGYEWCDEFGGTVPVRLPEGDTTIDLRFAYSMTSPRLEIVRSIPGTVWTPAAGSGIHHLGYWSDDVPGDSANLDKRGYRLEAAGIDPEGVPFWAYHRGAEGPRIELVSRALQPALQSYFDTGHFS